MNQITYILEQDNRSIVWQVLATSRRRHLLSHLSDHDPLTCKHWVPNPPTITRNNNTSVPQGTTRQRVVAATGAARSPSTPAYSPTFDNAVRWLIWFALYHEPTSLMRVTPYCGAYLFLESTKASIDSPHALAAEQDAPSGLHCQQARLLHQLAGCNVPALSPAVHHPQV